MMDVDRFYVELGARIRSRRVHVGVDQASLAGSVGLGRTSISNIEAGRQRVQLHVLCMIADTLDTTVAELLPATVDQAFDLKLPNSSLVELNTIEIEWIRSTIRGAKEQIQDGDTQG